MKVYLVTGGAGFIGSHYIRGLLRGDNDVCVVNMDKLTYAGNLGNLSDVENDSRYVFVHGDICDSSLLSRLFEKYRIGYVVNFAAESHVDRSIENPGVFVETNVNGTVALLNAALRAWQEADGAFQPGVKFLQVSTDEVYGALGKVGYFTEATPLDPHSPYSASKASADLLVKAFYDTYGLPANITRCSNNYGPYQFPEKLIPLMIHNALKKKALPVYGDGMQVRDWLYVEDHCAAIELVLKRGVPGEAYNIGGNNERPNIEIVKRILLYLHERADAEITEALITHVTDRPGHDRRYAIDASKIKRDLGWEPTVSFSNGLRKTIDWYLANQAWLTGITSGEYMQYYEVMYGSRKIWK